MSQNQNHVDIEYTFDFDRDLTAIFPSEFFEPIGRGIVYWSALDNHVDQAIWRLAGLDPESGVVITRNIHRFQTKLEILDTLMAAKLPGHCRSEFKNNVLPLINDANTLRDIKLAHGLPVKAFRAINQKTFHALLPLRDILETAALKQHSVTVKSLENIAQKIHSANEKFVDFVRKHIAPAA